MHNKCVVRLPWHVIIYVIDRNMNKVSREEVFKYSIGMLKEVVFQLMQEISDLGVYYFVMGHILVRFHPN